MLIIFISHKIVVAFPPQNWKTSVSFAPKGGEKKSFFFSWKKKKKELNNKECKSERVSESPLRVFFQARVGALSRHSDTFPSQGTKKDPGPG